MSEAILQNSSNRRFIGSVITSDANGNVQWNKDEGCWLLDVQRLLSGKVNLCTKQYEALISEATGIQNVIVIEESRSAVFPFLKLIHFATRWISKRCFGGGLWFFHG